jgi:hypothetical protein
MGLLGRGLCSLRLNEDVPAVVAMVTVATIELVGTCKIPDK